MVTVHMKLQRLQHLQLLRLLLLLRITSASVGGGLVVVNAYSQHLAIIKRWEQRRHRYQLPPSPPCSLRNGDRSVHDMYDDRGIMSLSSNFDRNNDQNLPQLTTTTATPATVLYEALATSGRREFEASPNSGNFFYNDEVISHLQGYMYLVGFFAGQDGLFVTSFVLWNSIGAYLTQTSQLPANPRIPAVIAIATFITTILLRYGLSWDPVTEFLVATIQDYNGPNDVAWTYEFGISILNICWGFLGTWKTKQPASDGATYGF